MANSQLKLQASQKCMVSATATTAKKEPAALLVSHPTLTMHKYSAKAAKLIATPYIIPSKTTIKSVTFVKPAALLYFGLFLLARSLQALQAAALPKRHLPSRPIRHRMLILARGYHYQKAGPKMHNKARQNRPQRTRAGLANARLCLRR